jgi:hypothetical protein
MRGERVLQVIFCRVEGEISYKQFITHAMFTCSTCFCFPRLFPTIGSKIATEPSSPEILHALKLQIIVIEQLWITCLIQPK